MSISVELERRNNRSREVEIVRNLQKHLKLSFYGCGISKRKDKKMLSFTIHKFGDTALFRCAGRFVSGDTRGLRDAIWSQWSAQAVVLDLAQIAMIDAAGLGTLVALRTWAQTAGISFKLMNLTPRVEEMLELTNLKGVFEVSSAADMLDLLYHAIEQARSSSTALGIAEPVPEYGVALSGRNGCETN
jgi:anti-anti-sigma factor